MFRVGVFVSLLPRLLLCVRGLDAQGTSAPVPTTESKFGVATTLIIPCYYTDFNMLSVVLESVSRQTVMPDETLLVLSQDTTNVNGSTLMNFDFPSAIIGNDFKRRDDQFDPSPLREGAPKIVGEIVRANGQPVESSILKVPNLKILVRTGTYYAGHNRMHGVDNSRNETQVFFFFDCDDYMHHRRTEYITKVSLYTF